MANSQEENPNLEDEVQEEVEYEEYEEEVPKEPEEEPDQEDEDVRNLREARIGNIMDVLEHIDQDPTLMEEVRNRRCMKRAEAKVATKKRKRAKMARKAQGKGAHAPMVESTPKRDLT